MDNDVLRTTSINDSEAVANKSRFGLFSQPLSTAIGDDGPYKTKIHPRQQSGKPVTTPRGIFTNPIRSGQLTRSYFGNINSLAEMEDEYVDPARKLLQIENQTFLKTYNKEQPFKPASNIKELHLPSYQYKLVPNPELNPKRNREDDGKVKAKPRNVYTNLQSTVIKSFFKPIKYMEDPYDRAHHLQSQKMKRDKLKEHESAFRPNSFSFKLFNSHKQVYEQDVELKAKTFREPQFNIYKHQTRWKDTNQNRSGIYGSFQPFPKYMENPPKERQRITIQKQKQVFKKMSVSKSKPSPSITLRNISKSKMSKSFSLRR